MAKMTHRTTYSLDEKTVLRVRELAAVWKVSQAEVIRRAVAGVEKKARVDVRSLLEQLHRDGNGLSEGAGNAYLAEVYEDRQRWRGE
jgi:hypothetical protein